MLVGRNGKWLPRQCGVVLVTTGVLFTTVSRSAPPGLRLPGRHGQTSLALAGAFEENRGQAPEQARFQLHQGNVTWSVGSDGLAWEGRRVRHRTGDVGAPVVTGSARARITLRGASPTVGLVGEDRRRGVGNYYYGSDPARWIREVPQFDKVRSRAVYPGVDVVYYLREGHLEFDFVVAPGADPGGIRLGLEGAGPPVRTGDGALVLPTTLGALRLERPVAYQFVAGGRRPVAAEYAVLSSRSDEAGFTLGRYDRSAPLIIDPVVKRPAELFHSTLLGGNGPDFFNSMTLDAVGNLHLIGSTFRTPPGGVGSFDVMLIAIAPDGTLLRQTVIGGPAGDFPEDLEPFDFNPEPRPIHALAWTGGAGPGYPVTPGA
ncbi:MAG: hypothetical protein FJX77_12520, partial [Armatimonadetes bacterium]|nr:hypothetical protein [Armatimonadota bacterium]